MLGTVLNSGLKSKSSSCQGRVRCPAWCSWSPPDIPWHCPHLSALGLPALGSALLPSRLHEPLKGRGQICLLCCVPSAQRRASPGTTALVLFCGVEPSEVRVSRGYGASSLLQAQDPLDLFLSSALIPTIPRCWPSPERWGGQGEEEGETGRAEQRAKKPPCCLATGTAGTVLAGAACWAEITMETWLGEGHWQWLRAGGGGGDRDLCRGSQPAPGPFWGAGKAGA